MRLSLTSVGTDTGRAPIRDPRFKVLEKGRAFICRIQAGIRKSGGTCRGENEPRNKSDA